MPNYLIQRQLASLCYLCIMNGRNWGSVLTVCLCYWLGIWEKYAAILMIYFCFWFQFQRTFESLKNVSNKSDLQKTYQKLGKELENLDYLAFKRQQVGFRALLGGRYEHFSLLAFLPVRGSGGSGETYLLIFRAEISCAVWCRPAVFTRLPAAFNVVLAFICALWGFPRVSLYLF